jgi:hypothetical protein
MKISAYFFDGPGSALDKACCSIFEAHTISNLEHWSDPVVLAEHSAKLRGKKRSEQAKANIRAARLAYLARMKGGPCPIR